VSQDDNILNLAVRPRRIRQNRSIRALVRETVLTKDDFILPIFVAGGTGTEDQIATMPGIYRRSVDRTIEYLKPLVDRGLNGVALFPAIEPKKKTPDAKEALNPKGLVPQAITQLKDALPDCLVFSDIALDPFSSDGHDGLVDARSGRILNDETVSVLAEMAVVHARAGVDFVAPSDMMDGRVAAIRYALDEAGFGNTGIMSYAAKFASAFYGPFRDALQSAPKHGDKLSYQIDPANGRQAINEALLDIEEGADMVMVKPALPYLDILNMVAEESNVPVCAYQVSGEYSTLHAASNAGAGDLDALMLESLTCIKRAGADLIFSYFADTLLSSGKI